MKEYVAQTLNKLLGDVVEDLDVTNLPLQILKGNVTLSNLKIKASYVNALGFPFDLKVGHFGNVNVQIPWLNLKSEPLVIDIDQVFILLKPKVHDDWNTDVVWDSY